MSHDSVRGASGRLTKRNGLGGEKGENEERQWGKVSLSVQSLIRTSVLR